jgi:hypothetical protein
MPQILFRTNIADGEIALHRMTEVGKARNELIWKHADGHEETIDEALDNESSSLAWTIEAAFNEGDHLAMVRANAIGALEYWLFEAGQPGWKLSARAALGSQPVAKHIKFIGIRSFRIFSGKAEPDRYEITDVARGGDGVYRSVLKNGILLKTPGIRIGNEIKRSTSANAQMQSQSTMRPAPSLLEHRPLEVPLNAHKTTTWLLWSAMVVATTASLWLVLRRRK